MFQCSGTKGTFQLIEYYEHFILVYNLYTTRKTAHNLKKKKEKKTLYKVVITRSIQCYHIKVKDTSASSSSQHGLKNTFLRTQDIAKRYQILEGQQGKVNRCSGNQH